MATVPFDASSTAVGDGTTVADVTAGGGNVFAGDTGVTTVVDVDATVDVEEDEDEDEDDEDANICDVDVGETCDSCVCDIDESVPSSESDDPTTAVD